MSVNIRLCGNISRKDCKDLISSSPCSLHALTSQTSTLCVRSLAGPNVSANGASTHRSIAIADSLSKVLQNKSNMMNNDKLPLSPLVEPPSWAVAATGESRLEPVCESLGRQCAVDLTKKASFRIGRSPSSDIQLMHATSSRRHAMLFHHSNGSCYIIDCGSAHGSFVNGKRIASPSKNGVVVPHRIRKGSLVRFGGPGAPCFVLKSFSFQLEDLKATETSDMGELIRRNTRLNALGTAAGNIVNGSASEALELSFSFSGKRSFDSMDSQSTIEADENPCFKRRCMSPPPTEEVPVALVSPDASALLKRRRVTFSSDPPQTVYPSAVTPDELSSEEDNA